MHAVEAADHKTVEHVDHRLGHRILERLEGRHALLHQHVGDGHTLLDHRHLVALLAVEADHLGRVLHAHHAHAVGAGVGLDHDEGRLVDAQLAVLGASALEHLAHGLGQTLLAGTRLEIHAAADAPEGVDHPRIDADEVGELGGDIVVETEVLALAAAVPAGLGRRHDGLVDATQDVRHAGGEVVVEQHHAGVEVG